MKPKPEFLPEHVQAVKLMVDTHGRDKVRAAFNKLGVGRLRDVEPEERSAFLAKVEAELGA